MAAPIPPKVVNQVKRWLQAGHSVTEVQEKAAAKGWSISRGKVSELRQEVFPGQPGSAEQQVLRQVQAAAAPTPTATSSPTTAAPAAPAAPEAPPDHLANLREQLTSAQHIQRTSHEAKVKLAASKLIADLTKQIRDLERAGEGDRAPRRVYYFPERVDIVRLESEEP